MKFVIFHSLKRKEKLSRMLEELSGLDVTVIDDPATFGKDRFWMRMRDAFEICLSSEHNEYCIMPDDVEQIQVNNILWIAYLLGDQRYSVNLINDGRRNCWNANPDPAKDRELIGLKLIHSDYNDCGFISNRSSMEGITIEPVRKSKSIRMASSGVGRQLTIKFRASGVPMYTAYRSLVYHGDHPSVMHPLERLKTPLISK